MPRVLSFIVDAATPQDLQGYLKALWDRSSFKGTLAPIAIGHTVTTAWALMSGRVPRWEGRPVADWYYNRDEDGLLKGTYDMRNMGDTLVGASGLREVWFNIPLMHPVPRKEGVVCVGGTPWFKVGYYTQPPWLQQKLEEMGYIPDVPDQPPAPSDPNLLAQMARKRGEALAYVLREFEWDFAFAWFPELDRLHHTQLFPQGTPYDTPENRRRIMNAIDAACFQVARETKPDYIVVFSDHGWNDEIKYHWPNSFYLIHGPVRGDPPKAASVLDILPTVYDLLGVKEKYRGEGVSLLQPKEWNLGGVSEDKVKASYEVVKKAVEKWGDSLAVAWSGGKDSTVVLVLAHRVKPDVKVLFLDTYAHFRETLHYRDLLGKLFDLNLYTLRRDKPIQDMAVDKKYCCLANKVEPLHEGIEELGIKAILSGIKRTDGLGREKAPVEEAKKTKSGYEYVQINPILEWTEDESLRFLEANGVPLNNLYYQGYRSIDCMPCTERVLDMSKPERWGRREKDKIVSQIRAMGYF